MQTSTFTTHPWEKRDKAQGLKAYQCKTEKEKSDAFNRMATKPFKK